MVCDLAPPPVRSGAANIKENVGACAVAGSRCGNLRLSGRRSSRESSQQLADGRTCCRLPPQLTVLFTANLSGTRTSARVVFICTPAT